jgi:hypothetical protein
MSRHHKRCVKNNKQKEGTVFLKKVPKNKLNLPTLSIRTSPSAHGKED